MRVDGQPSTKVIVYGLDDRLSSELQTALGPLSANSESCQNLDQCLGHLDPAGTQVIFCSFENGLHALLRAVSGEGRDVPVIAVSRHADVHRWIEAIEAGANDYCAAPFEPLHLKWILQSNVHPPFKPVASPPSRVNTR